MRRELKEIVRRVPRLLRSRNLMRRELKVPECTLNELKSPKRESHEERIERSGRASSKCPRSKTSKESHEERIESMGSDYAREAYNAVRNLMRRELKETASSAEGAGRSVTESHEERIESIITSPPDRFLNGLGIS